MDLQICGAGIKSRKRPTPIVGKKSNGKYQMNLVNNLRDGNLVTTLRDGKRTNPYPRLVRRILRRVLPSATYQFHFINHEIGSLKLWRSLATKLSRQDAVLDIGAFYGEYALAAREVNLTLPIFAFEPDPDNLAMMTRKCENQSIEICPVAVGGRSGTAQFVSSESKAQCRLTDQSSESPVLGQLKSVPVVSLDDWTQETGAKPLLIKMDVEGGEPDIILGARQTLKTYRPTILVEVLSGEAGERLRTALPINCRFFHIHERNGISEHTRMWRRFWHSRNWLLVPEGAALSEEILRFL
jgi:FkbM family methyltransferase